jgi:hypothetical protein
VDVAASASDAGGRTALTFLRDEAYTRAFPTICRRSKEDDMNRSRILVPSLVCLTAVLLLAADGSVKNHVPRAATRDAVMTYVKDAAAVVQKSGASACDTLAKPEWRANDYYVFVSGPDNKLLCHPSAAMVGKPTAAVVNKSGDKIGEKISKMGEGDGAGWLEYMWAPRAGAPEEMKTTYAMGVTGPDGKHYVVGAGAFRMAK